MTGQQYKLRLITQKDSRAMADVIRTVSAEFGLTAAAGFAVGDASLNDLYLAYQHDDAQYFVITDQEDTNIYGGGGIAPLLGDDSVLELQKMYFLPQVRGLGFASQIIRECCEFAKAHNYTHIYLETTNHLSQACVLYEKLGFKRLDKPMGNTGHSHVCEIWMAKSLSD